MSRYKIFVTPFKYEIWDTSNKHLAMLVTEKQHALFQCLKLNNLGSDVRGHSIESFLLSENQRAINKQ